MAILIFKTSSYALSIYSFGTNRLTARDGFVGVATGYYLPVQQFARNNLSTNVIDNALAQNWISQQEYDETMALIPA